MMASSACSAGTLLSRDGVAFPTVFAFVACVELVQSHYVLDGRMVSRVCPSKH